MRIRSHASPFFLLRRFCLLPAKARKHSKPNGMPTVTQLSQVQRVYVEPLTGTAAAQALARPDHHQSEFNQAVRAD